MKIGTITKEVPVPSGKGGKYDWLKVMEVGESVNLVFDDDEESQVKARDGVLAAARRFGIKVVVQRDMVGELRVWRVEAGKKRARRVKKAVEGIVQNGE